MSSNSVHTLNETMHFANLLKVFLLLNRFEKRTTR